MIQNLSNWILQTFPGVGGWVSMSVLVGLVMVGFCAATLGFVANIAGISTYVERKFAARVQQRIGPSEVHIRWWWGVGLIVGLGLAVVYCFLLALGYTAFAGGEVSLKWVFLHLLLLEALLLGGLVGFYVLEFVFSTATAFGLSLVNLLVVTALVCVFQGDFSGGLYLTNLGFFLMLGAGTAIGGYLGYRAGLITDEFMPFPIRPFGLFQFMADGVKLISKEDIIPADADRPLFKLAPFLVFAGSFPIWAVIPMSKGVYAADMNIGLLYIFAVAGVGVVGILLAGWASGNKWSLYGAMRSAAQIVSYELPSGITFLTIVMVMGTLNLNEIVATQSSNGTPWLFKQIGLAGVPGGLFNWFFFRYPPFTWFMFVIFFVSGVAEVNRAPFDLPESESELVAGFHTEYTGMRFAFFFMAEYVNMFMIGVITSVLFLGGWHPPYPGFVLPAAASVLPISMAFWGPVLEGLEGFLWFVVKGYFFVLVMMLMRWTLPRYRVDQLMHLAWKVMIPIAFINLTAIGLWASLLH